MERKKLMSIKEFSELSGTEQSTLRYWESIGLFTPAMRHQENNYRFYTPEQLMTVNFITALSELKVPLKTIGRAGEDRSPEKILSLLEQQEFEIDGELNRLRSLYSSIHVLRSAMRQGMESVPGEIGVQRMEETAIFMGPPTAFEEEDSFYRPFMEYCRQAKRSRKSLINPIGGYHDSLQHYMEYPSRPQHFFSLDPMGCDCRPAGLYLVGYAQGYYGQLDGLPGRLATYAQENELLCEGPVYVIYLLDEICIQEPAEYLAQVSVRVCKRRAP